MTSPMYKGGWWLCIKHKLPTKTIVPTEEELAKYETEKAEYDRQLKESALLFEEMLRLVKEKGLSFRNDTYDEDLEDDGEDNPIGPSIPGPDKPVTREVEYIESPLDAVTKKYLETGEEQYLLRAAAMGAPIIYQFSGGSAMGYETTFVDFLRDGPKIPDGVKVEGIPE